MREVDWVGTLLSMSGDPNLDVLQESGWEELRKEARKIEGDLDVKLSSYAKLGAMFTQGGKCSISFALLLGFLCWLC